MRNTFLTFGQRLQHLMKQKGIDRAADLSRSLYDACVISYTEAATTEAQREEQRRSTERSINIHLKYETGDKLSGKWLMRYCKFFGCSADYLLGYIDLPDHASTDINGYTGLSEAAIVTLHSWKDANNLTPAPAITDTLSKLIETQDSFMSVLASAWNYHLCRSRATERASGLAADNVTIINTGRPSDADIQLWTASRDFTNCLEDLERKYQN